MPGNYTRPVIRHADHFVRLWQSYAVKRATVLMREKDNSSKSSRFERVRAVGALARTAAAPGCAPGCGTSCGSTGLPRTGFMHRLARTGLPAQACPQLPAQACPHRLARTGLPAQAPAPQWHTRMMPLPGRYGSSTAPTVTLCQRSRQWASIAPFAEKMQSVSGRAYTLPGTVCTYSMYIMYSRDAVRFGKGVYFVRYRYSKV